VMKVDVEYCDSLGTVVDELLRRDSDVV